MRRLIRALVRWAWSKVRLPWDCPYCMKEAACSRWVTAGLMRKGGGGEGRIVFGDATGGSFQEYQCPAGHFWYVEHFEAMRRR